MSYVDELAVWLDDEIARLQDEIEGAKLLEGQLERAQAARAELDEPGRAAEAEAEAVAAQLNVAPKVKKTRRRRAATI